jgi:hypothetical protein
VKNQIRRFRDRLLSPLNSRLDAVEAGQRALRRSLDATREDAQQTRFAVAALRVRDARAAASLRDAEFKAYSQFGEDGIIQWLLGHVPIASRTFVEFGVEDYRESNTRFLLEHDGWSGRILDAGTSHQQFLRTTGLAWRHVIDAREAFITAENIDELLAGMPKDLGLLSVDVDGMDYWILSAIHSVRPRIVICEYNGLFGPTAAVTVPYRADFDRTAAHPSTLYFGASISALAHWAAEHGYRFVGGTSQGVNAFFVRDDVAGDVPETDPARAWVDPPIRQARDGHGALTLLTGRGPQLALMRDLPLIDVRSGAAVRVADLATIEADG